MPLLTAVVLTLNEEAHLPDCLASLAFADAVLVFDSFSTDRTIEIAGAAGARVVQHAFTDYAAQRNAALDAVQSDWVFFVDADERVPAPLAQAVRSAIAQPAVAAWWVPRHNYILGRLTLQAGWFPDYQLRLLR
ncbi:MAG: glycosyltransferase family 2 protein, partial [Chloroflexi bacterium]|nr:glycosyltransferase family 2 protein [Chloroflexota bacterium]